MALNSSGLLKGFNIGKIVGGINDTLNIVNKTIPIYKQVSPIVKNVLVKVLKMLRKKLF